MVVGSVAAAAAAVAIDNIAAVAAVGAVAADYCCRTFEDRREWNAGRSAHSRTEPSYRHSCSRVAARAAVADAAAVGADKRYC